jgi:hypothetical protein
VDKQQQISIDHPSADYPRLPNPFQFASYKSSKTSLLQPIAKKRLEMSKKVISIALVAALTASSAQAATLTNISGVVSVDKGSGFVPAVSDVVVSSGDRIRVVDGSASIDYGSGCAVQVGRGQVVAVAYETPCAGTPAGGLKDGVVADDTGSLLVPGLIVAGVGGAVAGIILSENNNKPASP